jgi:hypothetical protein
MVLPEQETSEALEQLPERGRELLRAIEGCLGSDSLELVEKALLALKGLAETPWGKAHMQVRP